MSKLCQSQPQKEHYYPKFDSCWIVLLQQTGPLLQSFLQAANSAWLDAYDGREELETLWETPLCHCSEYHYPRLDLQQAPPLPRSLSLAGVGA